MDKVSADIASAAELPVKDACPAWPDRLTKAAYRVSEVSNEAKEIMN